jgi:hypothetical protein
MLANRQIPSRKVAPVSTSQSGSTPTTNTANTKTVVAGIESNSAITGGNLKPSGTMSISELAELKQQPADQEARLREKEDVGPAKPPTYKGKLGDSFDPAILSIE